MNDTDNYVNETVRLVEDFYYCDCDTIILRSNDIDGHMSSNEHIQWQENNRIYEPETEVDCDICYNPEKSFYKCNNCKRDHCVKCHQRISKCPFCRELFNNVNNRDRLEHDFMNTFMDLLEFAVIHSLY
jgi:hypothetical protein